MLPETVIILGKTYRIVYVDVPDDHKPLLTANGSVNTLRQRIVVNLTKDRQDTIDTILHEIGHAICDELDLDIHNTHKEYGQFITVLADVLTRNGLLHIQ
jgi:Zn-dependent peptidase ImmA (M78 family)